ncbi:energy-coupling factor ABC transporter ATP-binding protein [Schlesneria sp. DSM 10557]|uniref:energy-coupling factor ABC transporter ATP-binding protein n=1 Tax=Schlesneria sp. DSM 10557 TaxID=3044399 RepID=UPI0035A15C2D
MNAAPPMRAIELRKLSFRYPNGRVALEDLSCCVDQGERIAVVGPSGAGKSTLLMHLNGLLPSPAMTQEAQAQVFIESIPVIKGRLPEVRRKVGFLFQDPDDQLFCPTVREDVAFGPLNLGLAQAEVMLRVNRSLAAVSLPEHGARNPSQLSTGERKRVCLAGVLACEPSMLVLDEPTSNLDPRARRQLLEILRSFKGTQIIATHDLDFALDLCQRAFVLDGGKIQADGPVEQVLANPVQMERHGLEVPWRLRRG